MSRTNSPSNNGAAKRSITLRALWGRFSSTGCECRCLCLSTEGAAREDSDADALLQASLDPHTRFRSRKHQRAPTHAHTSNHRLAGIPNNPHVHTHTHAHSIYTACEGLYKKSCFISLGRYRVDVDSDANEVILASDGVEERKLMMNTFYAQINISSYNPRADFWLL